MFGDDGLVGGIAELAMKTYQMYFEQRHRGFDGRRLGLGLGLDRKG